jgi:2-methylisocitrate lyase-like PEP mutase family enzyme
MPSPALRQEVENGGFITAPGVFDLISALIADHMGFKALYVSFVESPESETEVADIGRRIGKPLLANRVNGGRTPMLPADRLKALGFSIAIYPAVGFSRPRRRFGAPMPASSRTAPRHRPCRCIRSRTSTN